MMQVKPIKDAKVETIRYFVRNYNSLKEGVFLKSVLIHK